MAFSIPFVSVVSLVVLAHLSCATRAQELSTPANEECWEDYVNLTAPIALTCTTPIADTMMLVGGISTCCQVEPPNATPVKGSNQVVGINLMYNANWDLVGNLSMNLRGASTCTSFRQKLVVTPAAQDANANSPATNVVTTYDPNTLAVVSVSTFTFPRRRAAIAATAFYTYVFGGVDAQGKPVFEIERSNGTAWETICVSTKPLCDCAVAVHEVEIFLVCSSCDTAGIGEEGIRNVFVSYWIETNTLMTVMDWPQQFGQGPMVSITGAAIAQYAVFVAFYLGNIWPVAYYWDLYLCQMHVMTTAWLTVPRITGSAFSAVDSIYYVGGQYFPQPNVTLNELTLNVGQLPVIETLVAQVYSRENNTFYVNEQVDVRCTAGLRLRISNSIDCRSVAPGTNDDNCNGPNTPLYMPVTQPLPIAFLCLARGTCAVPVGQRRQCGGDNETFRSCNREWGCCFDSVRQECFQYEIPQTQSDRVYFQTASLVTFSVVPLPVTPPAVPSTNSLANFARSTPGIIVFAAVGFVLCLSVFLIVKFGVAPRGMGSGNLSDGFDVIHGKYVVERKLGQGGFGQVFLVKRKTDGERFALKYIPCSSDEDRSFAIKEFELVRAAQGHPNMITIHDMFLNWSDDDLERSITQMVPKHGPTEPSISSPLVDANRRFVCIVMTYCPGGDLAQYIQKCVSENRRISEQWIMQTLARQMVAVLHHLHNRATPIIHRDLKPENVLLSLDRTSTMLTDFGLASQQDRTYMTTRAGSLHYVAPECWKKHYSSSVDLWAVGCILYATATGRVTVATARVMFNDAKEKGFQKEIRRELVEKYKYSDEFASFVLAFLQVDHKKRLTAQAATRWLDDLAAGIPRQTSNSSPNRSSSRPTPDVSRTISSGSVDSGPVTPDLDHTIVTPPLPTRQAADV